MKHLIGQLFTILNLHLLKTNPSTISKGRQDRSDPRDEQQDGDRPRREDKKQAHLGRREPRREAQLVPREAQRARK